MYRIARFQQMGTCFEEFIVCAFLKNDVSSLADLRKSAILYVSSVVVCALQH